MISQTWAIVVDGYRELHAKKLFWATMLLSGLVVAAFGATSINENGIGVLGYTIEVTLPAGVTSELWYNFLFLTFGTFWITWVASILGLITTAGIIPDFVSGGAIELSLSKPISRVRLFLTKYFVGLLFVTLQVSVFTVACLLVFGIRGGNWDFRLLLAIPVVVCFFSYLHCVCALAGVITRSTIAALLVTILFWFIVFLVNAAETTLYMQRAEAEARSSTNSQVADNFEALTREQLIAARSLEEDAPTSTGWEPSDDEILAANPFIQSRRDAAERSERSARSITPWYRGVRVAELTLPKTGDTIDLLSRYLPTPEEMFGLPDADDAVVDVSGDASDIDDRKINNAAQASGALAVVEAARTRPVWSILGTSLAFEAVILAIACLIFRRRDF